VKVSDSQTVHKMDKRLLAQKSEYFRSYLVRFHTNMMDEQEMSEKMVELNSEFVSSEAWTVIKMYVEFGELQFSDEVAFELLQATNYLQMDSVQAQTVEYLKKLVSKTNFLTVYDFAVVRGITSLSSYITSTIIKPAEVMRRRKYGVFDMNLKLGQLVFKCHQAVLSSMSLRIKTVMMENQGGDRIVDSASFGIGSENSQLFYNVFELVYLGMEDFSIYSFEEAISVFKILQSLKFDYKFIQPCLTSLARLVSLTNYSDIYQAGCEAGHEGVKNIALYFLMHAIEQLKESQFFLSLPSKELCKIISHSYLNVPNEFCVVELVFSWLCQQDINATQLDTIAMELLGHVRWSRISSAEVEHLMRKDLVTKSNTIQQFIKTSQTERLVEKVREWPRMLVIVEQPPLQDKKVESEYKAGLCSVQSYDTDTKSWSSLTSVPGTASAPYQDMWRDEGYSVTCVQNTLVMTSPNSSVPYMPIAVQTYDFWSDSWSKEPQLNSLDKASNEQEHSTMALQGKMFTVLTPKDKQSRSPSTVCLHAISGVQTDTPVYTISCHTPTGPHPGIDKQAHTRIEPTLASTGDRLLHVIGHRAVVAAKHCTSLDTYNTTTQAWTHGYMSGGHVVQAGWVGWNGGIARVGGVLQDTQKSSDQCLVFPVQGGDPRHMASLARDRIKPGLVEYKGMLFAAGGYKQLAIIKEKKRKRKKEKFEQVVESSVEYYIPELDCWNLMKSQPKLSYGRVTMVVVDKPIRIMARGNVTFKLRKGVKRQLE